jgi:hypothetical protein
MGLLMGLLASPGPALSNEATIIGIFEDCLPVSSTIIFRGRPGELDLEQVDRIVAQAEAVSSGLRFDQALPLMIASLEHNGIENIDVQKQGACGSVGHGKYVEAVIGYCGEKVNSAELLIDGDVFFRHSGSELDFDSFVNEARERLQSVGIFQDPRVSLINVSDCNPEISS